MGVVVGHGRLKPSIFEILFKRMYFASKSSLWDQLSGVDGLLEPEPNGSCRASSSAPAVYCGECANRFPQVIISYLDLVSWCGIRDGCQFKICKIISTT